MSFSQPLPAPVVSKLLEKFSRKAFELHASSAWGSQEGYALEMAIAIADQLVEERDQRDQLLRLLANPAFSASVTLTPGKNPDSAEPTVPCAAIWTTHERAPDADQECFGFADVPVLADLFAKYGRAGLLAWACAHRGEDPNACPCPVDDGLQDACAEAWDYLKLNAARPLVSRTRIA